MQPKADQAKPEGSPVPAISALASARTAVDAVHDALRSAPAADQSTHIASQDERCRSLAVQLTATGVPLQTGGIHECDMLAASWAAVSSKVADAVTQADERFRPDVESLDRAFSDAALVVAGQQPADDLLTTLESRATTLKSDLERTRADALAPGSDVARQYSEATAAMAAELELIQAFSHASFKLGGGERPVRLIGAKLVSEGWNAAQVAGTLYASDQRLIFDAGGDGGPHQIAFEARYADLAEVRPAKEGLLGHEDHLYVRSTTPGASVSHFHLYGQDAELWRYPGAGQ